MLISNSTYTCRFQYMYLSTLLHTVCKLVSVRSATFPCTDIILLFMPFLLHTQLSKNSGSSSNSVRNYNKYRGRRNILKRINARHVNSIIAPKYFTNKYIGAPHCLIELSLWDWDILQHNCVHLSGMEYVLNKGSEKYVIQILLIVKTLP